MKKLSQEDWKMGALSLTHMVVRSVSSNCRKPRGSTEVFHSLSCFGNGHMWVRCHRGGLDRARDHPKCSRLWKAGEAMREHRRKVCSPVWFFSSSLFHHLSLHEFLKALGTWVNTTGPIKEPTKNGLHSKKYPGWSVQIKHMICAGLYCEHKTNVFHAHINSWEMSGDQGPRDEWAFAPLYQVLIPDAAFSLTSPHAEETERLE